MNTFDKSYLLLLLVSLHILNEKMTIEQKEYVLYDVIYKAKEHRHLE